MTYQSKNNEIIVPSKLRMANPPRQISKENKANVKYYAEDSIRNGFVLTWTEAVVEGSIPTAMMDGQ